MDATRHEILRHASDLFHHYGFRKTAMADIAERSAMSPGNLYRYYRNKQAIGIAVVEAHFRETEAEVGAALVGVSDPEERIRAVIRATVLTMARELDYAPKLMELVEFVVEEEEAYATLRTHMDWKRAIIEEALRKGMAAGAFREAPVYETAVNLMHATKAFQMPQSLAAWRDRDTILPELEGVLDLIFAGVRLR